ncbi:MAG TPA: O-antigen ligase domain-containing protein, partial [Cyanophyceae cyanobacterium]
YKPGWIALPIRSWCLCPLAAQLANGLSPISPTTGQIITWGVPYFIGRIYFNDLAALRQLAIGIFAGGMVYVPLCLLEMRISPTLHLRLYGYHARADFGQTMRYGGYRPTVLLEHGLWVGVWMMAATLLGILLWRTATIKKLWNYPMSWLVPILIVTFVLVKSTGAYLYLLMGIGIWFTSRWLRTALPLLLLSVAISLYLYLGATGDLYRIPQVNAFLVASESTDNDRSASVAFRIANEKLLAAKAQQRMMFGWGDSGGNRIYDELGNDISVTDSMWIIAYGQQGVFGLISFTAMLIVPSLGFVFLRYPPSTWSNRKVAPAVGLALILVLYLLDSVLNAMTCPVFMLANGGLAGLVLKEPETNRAKRVRAVPPRRTLAQQR